MANTTSLPHCILPGVSFKTYVEGVFFIDPVYVLMRAREPDHVYTDMSLVLYAAEVVISFKTVTHCRKCCSISIETWLSASVRKLFIF